MKNLAYAFILGSVLMLPFEAKAEEPTASQEEIIASASSLKANIKRLAFEYMEHSVTNKKDPNYPDT
jgi:hypothetical protein